MGNSVQRDSERDSAAHTQNGHRRLLGNARQGPQETKVPRAPTQRPRVGSGAEGRKGRETGGWRGIGETSGKRSCVGRSERTQLTASGIAESTGLCAERCRGAAAYCSRVAAQRCSGMSIKARERVADSQGSKWDSGGRGNRMAGLYAERCS